MNGNKELVKVSKEVHQQLKLLKAEKDFKSFNDLIAYLIQNQKES